MRHAVADALDRLGLSDQFSDLEDDDPRTLYGYVDQELVSRLKADHRFQYLIFVPYHKEIGVPRVEFRSHRGVLEKGSLQICINPDTDRCCIDIDRYPATSDVAGLIGHFFGEVVPGWFRRTPPPAVRSLLSDPAPVDPLQLPAALAEAPGVQFVAPPEEKIPDIKGVIGKALSQLSAGKSGGVFAIAEVEQGGQVKRVNAAIVQRIGDDFAIVGYVGKTWSPAGSDVHYGAALRWEWD